jgi:phosphopantetheinyl transferase (holo-ACP synthase)
VLTAAEQDLLADLDEEKGSWGFTRLWTIKEACLKALGIPLVGRWRKIQGTMEARGSWDGITWTQFDVAKNVTGSVALISRARGPNSEEPIAARFSL